MTHDNHKKSNRSQSSITTNHEDSIINLPDLSAFQEAEKRHIINVLIRDEDLRNKHLSRFMNLRKEVADLEQQSTTTSPSVCARCHTPFGFVFNTGDACPKCGAKVCKQCRLMYNVNDNGWLCQLCCKQMQLLSYSGEWIYSIRSNLRKSSKTDSEVFDEPLPASSSVQNINNLSSSDSDGEIPVGPVTRPDRFRKPAAVAVVPVKSTKRKDKVDMMIVQNSVDEKKLNFVKGRMKDRPSEASYTQPLARRMQIASPAGTYKSSSDDMNSVINKSNNRQVSSLNKLNSPMPKNVEELKRSEQEFDLMSVTSSEWGGDDDNNKSEKEKLKVQPQPQQQQQQQQQNSKPSIRDSKLSVASESTIKANQRHLSASMQNLRNKVHHRLRQPSASSRQNLTSSRTSLNSDMSSKVARPPTPPIDDENTIPSKITDKTSISNTRTTLRSRQTSVNSDEPKQPQSNIKRQESTNTTASKPLKRHVSIADSVATEQTDYTRQDSRTESLENRSSVGDSGDDIDRKFEKAKTGSLRRASSLRDMRGSHLSLTSLMSEAKARYELEITGTIQFKLSYNPKTGSFDIFIKQCNNLARAKRNQTSNPYCKVYLLPDKSKGSKRKTGVRKGTTDPVFGETLRYHLSLQEFTSRTLWISVWSESSLGQNDFLGEVHVQLDNCRIDELEEYKLLPRAQEEDVVAVAEPTTDPSELYFELTFIENTKNKEKGTIQVNAIQGKGISQGKIPVEAICKGLLMPDKIKKKLPIIRQGPSPKWDIPLRWEDIQLSDLKNTSLEISIWNQERFRKTMIGSIKLNSTRTHLESRAVKTLVASNAEKEVWEAFQKDPTKKHKVRLPLRPPPIQRK